MSRPSRFVKLLEAFTRPLVVAVVLLVLLAVNAFLLYRYLDLDTEDDSGIFVPQTVTEERTVERTVFVPSTEVPQEPEESEPGEAAEDGKAPGLEEGLQACQEAESHERCLKEAVSKAVPEARYVGGSTELNTASPGRNNRVLYFEDPGLEICEFERQGLTTNTDYLTVIVVGEGSFGAEAEPDCVPAA